LLGGIVIGVLASLPVVNLANLCCCAWAISGGLLSAWLLQQNHPHPVLPGDGALTGLIAGVFGAIVWGILYVPIHMLTGPLQRRLMSRVLENAGDVPPQFRAALEHADRGLVLGLVVGLLVNLMLFAIFGMLGGLLGAVLVRKPAPPPPPPIPPAPPLTPLEP
jgi:hypothetical protein